MYGCAVVDVYQIIRYGSRSLRALRPLGIERHGTVCPSIKWAAGRPFGGPLVRRYGFRVPINYAQLTLDRQGFQTPAT
jgi:hypothetical protein